MNKKAQIEIPVITLVAVIIALLILGPTILKLVNTILTPVSNSLGNISETAGDSVSSIKNSFINFWDWVLVIGFLVNVVLLLISAFLVATHPVFLVLYIIFGFVMFLFAPELLQIVDKFYSDPNFATEISKIPMMDFIRSYFGVILLAIFFISGIIIFARVYGRNNQ